MNDVKIVELKAKGIVDIYNSFDEPIKDNAYLNLSKKFQNDGFITIRPSERILFTSGLVFDSKLKRNNHYILDENGFVLMKRGILTKFVLLNDGIAGIIAMNLKSNDFARISKDEVLYKLYFVDGQ